MPRRKTEGLTPFQHERERLSAWYRATHGRDPPTAAEKKRDRARADAAIWKQKKDHEHAMRQPGAKIVAGGVYVPVPKAAQIGIPLDYQHHHEHQHERQHEHHNQHHHHQQQPIQQQMPQQQQWLEGPFNNVLDFDEGAWMGMEMPDIGLPIELEMMGQRHAKRYVEGGMGGSHGGMGGLHGGMGGLQNGMTGLHGDMGGFLNDSVAPFGGLGSLHGGMSGLQGGMGGVDDGFGAQMGNMGGSPMNFVAASTNNYNGPPGLESFQLPDSSTGSSPSSLLSSSNFSPRPNLSHCSITSFQASPPSQPASTTSFGSLCAEYGAVAKL